MEMNQDFLARKERVMEWYAPARLGLFVHWGLYTGGGMITGGPNFTPLTYPDIASFEAAAPTPEEFASNIVALAEKIGAKYINLTLLHSNDGYAIIYPTALTEFQLRTTKDYLGAVLNVCEQHGIRVMVYFPLEVAATEIKGGPYIAPGITARALYEKLIQELSERYGDKIGGFWLDGGFTDAFLDFPAYIRQFFPAAIINVNSCTFGQVADVDFTVTEFLGDVPSPAYDRPSGLRKMNKFNINVPPDDFNEDIPNCASWWYWKNRGRFAAGISNKEKPYLDDKFFLVKQLISSLGQRGQWNCTLGLPVLIDGTVEEMYWPMLDAVSEFLKWGSEAVYKTTGGIKSPIRPGSFHGGGYCSVTQSLETPSNCYVLVTEAPAAERSGYFLQSPHPGSSYAAFFTNGYVPVCISDLRSGEVLEFSMPGGNGVYLKDVDWSDVQQYGVKVLKVEFEYPETPTAL